MLSGVVGAAGGKLRGGRRSSEKVSLGQQWFSIKIEKGNVLTGGREGSWWREWRGGGFGGAGLVGSVAAAGVAGEEGDDPFPTIDG